MKITEYTISSNEIKKDYVFAVLSDLHNRDYTEVINLTKSINPDAILIVGDIVDRHRKWHDKAIPFLKDCVQIAPTYFSYGNHEVKYPMITAEDIQNTGVTLLDNSWTLLCNDILIGGQTPKAETDWLREFEDNEQFSILLDHHPEHYKEYLKEQHPEIDLIISGHAHGGQIRIKKQGLFSPGQGPFPKYTKGLYDDRLLVTTGLANTGDPIPRINNEPEVVKLIIRKEQI
ncbi:MAG: metallophosphoesterase [Clostridia bacterium]|nr:metallophosphoesterase [Clostridia bacterium]